MYKTHQPIIAKYGMKSPDNMARVATMVLLSIQQAWYNVGLQMDSVDNEGEASRFLWGSKRGGYRYLQEHKHELFATLHEYKNGDIDIADVLVAFSKVNGLGLVKAGFVCQLLLGEVGCLDVHNLRKFGVNPNVFKLQPTATDALRRKKAEIYIGVCKKLGGSEFLWNSWCESLADNPRCAGRFTSKHHVSRVHKQFLGL